MPIFRTERQEEEKLRRQLLILEDEARRFKYPPSKAKKTVSPESAGFCAALKKLKKRARRIRTKLVHPFLLDWKRTGLLSAAENARWRNRRITRKERNRARDYRDACGLSYTLDSYYSEHRIAVYTAVFDAYDEIAEPRFCPDNVDYRIVTNGPMPEGSVWKRLEPPGGIPAEAVTPTEKNRWCKMHPHILFPEYDYTIYIDGCFTVFSDVTPFIRPLERFPLATFRHNDRRCAYQEVSFCIAAGLDSPEALRRQRRTLRAHGLPRNWGLLECPVIAARPKDPLACEILEDWWRAFLEGSRRDQIAVMDVLWRKGIEPGRIATLGEDFTACDLIVKNRHARPRQILS